jgi:hypothetical protein
MQNHEKRIRKIHFFVLMSGMFQTSVQPIKCNKWTASVALKQGYVYCILKVAVLCTKPDRGKRSKELAL